MLMAKEIFWENAFSTLDPQINAEGVHNYPFDPVFPVDVRFFNFDQNHDIRMNRHDYFEIFYTESGETVCQIQNRAFPLRAGDLVIISSTQYHTMYPISDQSKRTPVKAAVAYFLPEFIRSTETNGDDIEYLMPFLIQGEDFPYLIRAESGLPEEIFGLIKRMSAELPATRKISRLTVQTYLRMILVLLANHYAAYRGAAQIFHRKQEAIGHLRPLFDFLDSNYHEPITVERAAQITGRSRSNFMWFFKQVTGQSFVSYLTHFRIAKAQEMLAATDRSIAEISYQVGFCDQSYFGYTFRKHVHMTPLQFRQQACS